MSIFRGQDNIALIFNTYIDLTGNTLLEIAYEKPSGTTGTWTATREGDNAVRYNITLGEIDEAGNWRFQAKVTFADGISYGDTMTINVQEPI